MQQPMIVGEPPEVEDWFTKTRLDLLKTWTKTTRHGVKLPSNGWACEIGRGCQSCTDHLSIPCSLATEAHEIALLLNKGWEEDELPLFFRLYLVTLSEFVRNLQKVAELVGVDVGRPPDDVCAWCNNFAKHRLCILIQHHPGLIAADAYGDAWPEFEKALPTAKFIDRCGNERPLQIIDRKWFCGQRHKDTTAANDEPQSAIVIPPLMSFLRSTMTYFRELVDACRQEPERVKQFESEHYATRCR